MASRTNWKFKTVVFVFLVVIGSSTIAFAQEEEDGATSMITRDDTSPPLVQFVWGDDLSEGPVEVDRLSFELENTSNMKKLDATASLLFIGAGEHIEMEIGHKNLKPEKAKAMHVKVNKFPVMSSSVSTQIVGRVVVTLPSGESRSYHTQPRYFHVDLNQKTATLYTQLQMVEEFNGGLIDRRDPDVDLTTITILGHGSDEEYDTCEMSEWEIEALESALPPGHEPFSVTVCGHWGAWFEDVGMGDYWKWSYRVRRARHAEAEISQYGAIIWEGSLDGTGCTPIIDLIPGDYELKQYSKIQRSNGAASKTYNIYHCEYNGQGFDCEVMDVTKSFSVASSGTENVYPDATGGWANASALTGFLLESSDSGVVYAGPTEIKMGHYCQYWFDEEEIITSCWDSDDDTVYISENSVNLKYVLAHEIGHQNQYDKIGNIGGDYYHWVTEGDWMCRCDHVLFENQLHCLQSREYIDVAAMEGFAYFFAAKLFNDATEEDCSMAYAKEFKEPDPDDTDNPDAGVISYPPVTVDCAEMRTWQVEYCDNSTFYDTGVELDWMNFFWEWFTGGGGAEPDPNAALMWEIYGVLNIDYSTIEDKAHWEDFRSRAQYIYNDDVLDPRYEYFDETAKNYGIRQGVEE